MNKVGVAYYIGCGPGPTNGPIDRLQFCLKLAEPNLSNIEREG